MYTAWLSLPVGERFFKVTFVARDKSFAFEVRDARGAA